jgi:hypothetical protein
MLVIFILLNHNILHSVNFILAYLLDLKIFVFKNILSKNIDILHSARYLFEIIGDIKYVVF